MNRESCVVYRESEVQSYKDLEVWEKGMEIVDLAYDIVDSFPRNERFGLTAQILKSAISIPSNIAEGYARQHTKEYTQFCSISLGSCAELETQLEIAYRRKFAPGALAARLFECLNHESRMLKNLIKALKSKA